MKLISHLLPNQTKFWDTEDSEVDLTQNKEEYINSLIEWVAKNQPSILIEHNPDGTSYGIVESIFEDEDGVKATIEIPEDVRPTTGKFRFVSPRIRWGYKDVHGRQWPASLLELSLVSIPRFSDQKPLETINKEEQKPDSIMSEDTQLAQPDKYSNIDFSPPKGVREAAQRALDVRAEKPESQRGMTSVGIARARDLANGRNVSPETARRMLAYFERHEVDKKGSTWDEQGKGWQAWQGWGGDAGFSWAKKIVRQMDAADEANMAEDINNNNNNKGEFNMTPEIKEEIKAMMAEMIAEAFAKQTKAEDKKEEALADEAKMAELEVEVEDEEEVSMADPEGDAIAEEEAVEDSVMAPSLEELLVMSCDDRRSLMSEMTDEEKMTIMEALLEDKVKSKEEAVMSAVRKDARSKGIKDEKVISGYAKLYKTDKVAYESVMSALKTVSVRSASPAVSIKSKDSGMSKADRAMKIADSEGISFAEALKRV